MAAFQFVARDSGGRLQRGVENASAAGAVVAELRQRGWSVVDVRESRDSSANDSSFASSIAAIRPRKRPRKRSRCT